MNPSLEQSWCHRIGKGTAISKPTHQGTSGPVYTGEHLVLVCVGFALLLVWNKDMNSRSISRSPLFGESTHQQGELPYSPHPPSTSRNLSKSGIPPSSTWNIETWRGEDTQRVLQGSFHLIDRGSEIQVSRAEPELLLICTEISTVSYKKHVLSCSLS